jgi:hypothetical protein
VRIWDRIREYFTRYRERDALRDTSDRLRLDLDRAYLTQRSLEHSAGEANRQYRELRAQIIQMRVSQSTMGRAGWEVMCFIPEECLDHMSEHEYTEDLVNRVAKELIRLALGGVNRVRANGTCCALVFEPLNINEPARAPKFVQALWDHDGKFKLSEKCWDQRTEEQRTRNAAGTI